MAIFGGRVFKFCFFFIFVISALDSCTQCIANAINANDFESLKRDKEVILRQINTLSKQEAKMRALEERVMQLEEQNLQEKDKKCVCENQKEKGILQTLKNKNVSKRVKRNSDHRHASQNVTTGIAGTTGMCAFSSILSGDRRNTGLTQTIVFDHVITNTGNTYNRHTGIFTAPSIGIFVFSWTMNCENINGHFQLMRNAEVITCISAETTNVDRGTASATMVLQLKRNDVVFIRTDHMYGGTSIVSNALMRSSFSGWQIF